MSATLPDWVPRNVDERIDHQGCKDKLASCVAQISYQTDQFKEHPDLELELLANRPGMTALMLASFNGEVELARALLQRGASIGLVNHYGRTALIMAAMAGRADVVELLLSIDCPIDAVDAWERDALAWAHGRGHERIATILSSKAEAQKALHLERLARVAPSSKKGTAGQRPQVRRKGAALGGTAAKSSTAAGLAVSGAPRKTTAQRAPMAGGRIRGAAAHAWEVLILTPSLAPSLSCFLLLIVALTMFYLTVLIAVTRPRYFRPEERRGRWLGPIASHPIHHTLYHPRHHSRRLLALVEWHRSRARARAAAHTYGILLAASQRTARLIVSCTRRWCQA